MIKNFLLSYWLWGILLIVFIVLILKDDNVGRDLSTYEKHKMTLKNVHFSQVEDGFEYARLYADECEMDDGKNNIDASNVRIICFNKDVATYTGRVVAKQGLKNYLEAKLWGDVRGWNTDNERFKSEEIHYFLNKKELHTQKPITIFKDNAILTGTGFRYNTQTKEAQVYNDVLIRIWRTASESAKTASGTIDGVPVAPPLSQIAMPPLRVLNATDTQASAPVKAPNAANTAGGQSRRQTTKEPIK